MEEAHNLFQTLQKPFPFPFTDPLHGIHRLLHRPHLRKSHFHIRRDLLLLALADQMRDGSDIRQDLT